MGQSFNLQGVLQAFRVLTTPRLMVPNLVVRDIRDINFEQLHRSGIKAIAFDKDNCLTKPYGLELYPPFEDAWKRCKDVYKDKIVIVSNSAGTPDDKDNAGAIAIEKALDVHVLRHQEKKPAGGDELLTYFDTIATTTHRQEKDISPSKEDTPTSLKGSQIAFVGDRALTDIVFGNKYGMFTILTRDVVTEEGDNPMAIRIRRMEHQVLGVLDRWDIKAKEHPIRIDAFEVVREKAIKEESAAVKERMTAGSTSSSSSSSSSSGMSTPPKSSS